MKHFSDQAIVLNRTDFGEADRILTFLTRSHGKVRGLARGVRKQKSKLAGGIELFSVSEISFLVGRSDVYTIASSRLVTHFDRIVKDLDRTNAAYDFIKQLNRHTEDEVEEAYFDLLQTTLEALHSKIDLDLIKLWFKAQLLKLSGAAPNLTTDKSGKKLSADAKYRFDRDSMCFANSNGRQQSFSSNDIKFLRLLFGKSSPQRLQKIEGMSSLLAKSANFFIGLNAG